MSVIVLTFVPRFHATPASCSQKPSMTVTDAQGDHVLALQLQASSVLCSDFGCLCQLNSDLEQAEEDAAARVEARMGPGVGAEAELRGWLEMGAEKCLAVRPLEKHVPAVTTFFLCIRSCARPDLACW